MFEQITRVPLIFSGPSIKQNTRVSELVQWMDIGPTILDLAGCESPKMEAISMLPALQGGHWQGRDYLFCEQVGDMVLTEVKFMSMIRSKSGNWSTTSTRKKGNFITLLMTQLKTKIFGTMRCTNHRKSCSFPNYLIGELRASFITPTVGFTKTKFN